MLRDFDYFDLDGSTWEIEDINMYFSLNTAFNKIGRIISSFVFNKKV